ncbi:MAG TPA: thiamine pyrophosphate-dependent enzyme, partial [Nitrospiria bacterium]|nr:thiamine pyrophosphate-dependent enzyme [Nitrospiria bacterium]
MPTIEHDRSTFSTGRDSAWCRGCGHADVFDVLRRALASSGARPAETVVVTGVGCSSLITFALRSYAIHGAHGRALPLALGVKAANPDLRVVVAGGDGDAFSIGGNHLLHAARKNPRLTYLIMDNQSYGMTRGQPSPTNVRETAHPLNALAVLLAAGATFVAQTATWRPDEAHTVIARALNHPGFSVVNMLSPCPTFHHGEGPTGSNGIPLVKEIGSAHDAGNLTHALSAA